MKSAKGFFITGTDTGVGKTEVSRRIARMFKEKGFKVGVMKPVATGVTRSCLDAGILKAGASTAEPLFNINPVSLKLPLAPLVASCLERKKIDMKKIWTAFKKTASNNDIVVVEGIGGVMVPIYKQGKRIFYVRDMIKRMKLDVIVVARPNLGTINHTLMTIEALKAKDVKIKGIIINHSSLLKKDISIRTNPSVIEKLSGVRVLGIMPYNKKRNKRRIKWLKKISF